VTIAQAIANGGELLLSTAPSDRLAPLQDGTWRQLLLCVDGGGGGYRFGFAAVRILPIVSKKSAVATQEDE